jgi:RNA polymerase sigma-70 factor (ECF subfamily)
MSVDGPLADEAMGAAAVPGASAGSADADRELARRFAAGESGAVRDLYARYAGPVLTVTLARLGDRSLADEAVQETLVKAWRARATFDPGRRLSPWVYTIARRVAADIARRERRRPPTTALPPSVPAEDVTTLVDTWEMWEVRHALGDLPDEEREVVRLTHYVGLSQSQIAGQLGLPIGTVKSRMHRAHRRLARRLAHLEAAV